MLGLGTHHRYPPLTPQNNALLVTAGEVNPATVKYVNDADGVKTPGNIAVHDYRSSPATRPMVI